MRALSTLLVVALVAALGACPPDWESLPYPPSEGEGEGEGDVCVGAMGAQGLEHSGGGIGVIVDMIDDEGDWLFAADSEGEIAHINVMGGHEQLGLCSLALAGGQLMRGSSGVLIRTGDNALCAVAAGQGVSEVAVSAVAPADVWVGGAVLVDADPAVVLVAYAEDPEGAQLSLATIEVTADGAVGPVVGAGTLQADYAEARLERIGADDRVAVAVATGELYEATPDGSGGVALTPRNRIADAGGAAFLAFGRAEQGRTPLIATLPSNNPDEMVWTGFWEEGASAWSSILRGAGFSLSGGDRPYGLLLTSGGCVVHYGAYGYLGVQAHSEDAMRPAVMDFRVKDVQRLARGPEDTVWALTFYGGVARWQSDDGLCGAELPPPTDSVQVDGTPTGVLVPVNATEALIGLQTGLARVDLTGGSSTAEAFDGRAVRDLLIDEAGGEALVVLASGYAGRVRLDTLGVQGSEVDLGVRPFDLDVDPVNGLAVARDEVATTTGETIFWVAAFDGASRSLVRCSWPTGFDPACEAPESIAAGPGDLAGEPERIGALEVLGDALIVLMSSGAQVGRFSPGDHVSGGVSWIGAGFPPPPGTIEYFTTSAIGSQVFEVRPDCALLTGFGSHLQALTLAPGAESVEDAHDDDRDPFQTALTGICDGRLLAAGGLGSTFYGLDVNQSGCGVLGATVLGPARPKDLILAGAQAGGGVWVAEGGELWHLPAP